MHTANNFRRVAFELLNLVVITGVVTAHSTLKPNELQKSAFQLGSLKVWPSVAFLSSLLSPAARLWDPFGPAAAGSGLLLVVITVQRPNKMLQGRLGHKCRNGLLFF